MISIRIFNTERRSLCFFLSISPDKELVENKWRHGKVYYAYLSNGSWMRQLHPRSDSTKWMQPWALYKQKPKRNKENVLLVTIRHLQHWVHPAGNSQVIQSCLSSNSNWLNINSVLLNAGINRKCIKLSFEITYEVNLNMSN